MNIRTNKILGTAAGIAAVVTMVASPLLSMTAYAANVTSFFAKPSREKASLATVDETISFVIPTGIAASETIIVTFSGQTINASFDFNDVDLEDNATPLTLAAAPSGATWGVVRTSSTVLTFTNGSSAVTSGHTVVMRLGTIATTGSTGTRQLTNPAAGTATVALTGTFGTAGSGAMTGTASIPIVDDDQVTVTATVNQTITFDIDTAVTNTNTSTPYSVALGTLTTAAAVNSDGATFNSIWLDLGTNAAGGVNVTVISSGGALKSTSVPADTIPSASATMAPGTANYGICVKANTATTGTLTKASPFNGATCTYGHTDTVGGVTTSAQNIITSTAPVDTGRVEIVVAAENSAVTPAHSDYSDTLTFIATATF